jgi:four helix bundle protein
MKTERFEDIIAWQKAHYLAVEIYKDFSKCKDYSFRDQIQRAVVSVMNNIAEGFERGINAELRHFLFIANGSIGEARFLLRLALSLKDITETRFKELSSTITEISSMLSRFIKTL